jgi:small conductance mechanosensitive channel
MIMIYRPFDVGDIINAGGVLGKVQSLTLVSTVITTFDNQRMVVPNKSVWGDVINNVTAEDKRRVDLVFGIGYDDDIPKAQRILMEIVTSHDLTLKDPDPVVRVHALGESSVDFVCRPWCKTDDYWTVHWDITEAVKRRFDEEGISIPFPQRDVHFYPQAEQAAGSGGGEAAPGGESRESRQTQGPGLDEEEDS